ncbi:MAG: hypothetical protein ACR2PQ_02695, partial [Myxococcota bacterium]
MILARILLAVSIALLAGGASAEVPSDVDVHDGVVHLLVEGDRVARYDLASRAWLADITLPRPAHAIAVGGGVLFYASDFRLFLVDLATEEETFLLYSIVSPVALARVGDDVFLKARSGYLYRLDPADGTEIGVRSECCYHGISFSAELGRIFATTTGSPRDFEARDLLPAGFGSPWVESPYHGQVEMGSKTFVMPGGLLVADSGGNIWDGTDLTWVDGLSGPFDDLVFREGLPVVLRSDVLHAYGPDFVETGRVQLSAPAFAIASHGPDVLAFSEGVEPGDAAQVSVVPPAAFAPYEPGPPDDPEEVAWLAAAWTMDDSGVLYLTSRDHASLFRWSLVEERYLPSIPLSAPGVDVEYHAAADRLYVATLRTGLREVDPESLLETRFAETPSWADCGLEDTGQHLLVCDPAPRDDGGEFFVFDPLFGLISQQGAYLPDFTWEPVSRRLYTTTGGLRYFPFDEDGALGDEVDDLGPEEIRYEDPIWFSRDGGSMLDVSGRVFDTATFEPSGSIEPIAEREYIYDAVWAPTGLVVLRRENGASRVDFLDADFANEWQVTDVGTPRGLVEWDGAIWLIARFEGRPRFVRIDPLDIDGDGVANEEDHYPSDPAEWSDRDSDGVGDNADVFPDDPTESSDRDGDGVGDNADDLPDDPTDSVDTDGDGVGDSTDAFPTNPLEWRDEDGDGFGDTRTDRFPDDPTEWADDDRDGIGDNTDAFPDDPLEAYDTD